MRHGIMLSRAFVLRVSGWGWVERMVRRSFLFRPMVRRFIAGDSLEPALEQCKKLLDAGFKVTLDYLGENADSEAASIAAKDAYIQMLRRIREVFPDQDINISIKLTQCGLDLGDDFAEKQFLEVLDVASECSNFVRVDMESSTYTERTLNILCRAFETRQNTGTVLQSYLYRTPEDVERLIGVGMRVRMVKGAYLEPEAVAFPEKSKVDDAYITLSKRLLESGNYPAIATHDEKIINVLTAFAKDQNIAQSRYEFQMLYGIRRDLQERLRKEGYGVRIYVPFGDQWYPYFTRRLAERPANFFFILRSLFKG